MRHVLITIDGDESRAELQAQTVLDLFGTGDITAHLCHVFVDNPEGASITQLPSVRRATARLEADGVDVQYHGRTGEPVTEIVESAHELDADVVCVAGRKRSPTGKLVFGSVTQDVILNTDRPVLVCGTSDILQG